ncbi:MAG TPA: hypothetical protein VHD62_15370 [Opitutaceae bacterium]|nr:hypothetical protein [Opitutaceae bacterium]
MERADFSGETKRSQTAAARKRCGLYGGICGRTISGTNGQPVQVSGFTQLLMVAGATSANTSLPAQTSQGRLVDATGADVTAQVIVNPTP